MQLVAVDLAVVPHGATVEQIVAPARAAVQARAIQLCQAELQELDQSALQEVATAASAVAVCHRLLTVLAPEMDLPNRSRLATVSQLAASVAAVALVEMRFLMRSPVPVAAAVQVARDTAKVAAANQVTDRRLPHLEISRSPAGQRKAVPVTAEWLAAQVVEGKQAVRAAHQAANSAAHRVAAAAHRSWAVAQQ